MAEASKIKRAKVAVLISGRGSNMKALVEAARDPGYPAEISLVVSNRPDAAGLAWAKDNAIPTLGLDHKHYESRAHFDGQLTSILETSKVDYVALAGFMRLLSEEFVNKWRDRLINIHPSLLPNYKGLNTHQRALDDGVKIAGCTVHYVRTEMDVGPIIAQAAVPVKPDDTADTLAERVLEAEHRLYPSALALVAEGRAQVIDERVKIRREVNQDSTLFSPPLR